MEEPSMETRDILPTNIQVPVTMVTTEAPPSPSNDPPVTTISATALVEILNSVASAVLPNPDLVPVGGADQQPSGVNNSSSSSLQLQFHLPTTAVPPTQVNEMSNDPSLSMKTPVGGGGRRSNGRGSSGRGSNSKGKEKQPWHYHLGGVRHCRVPLSPEIKEALEVAYVSRIMSKNYRKEGQPEKERLSQLTGLELDKVQEWFKNRRKKDKLITSRVNCQGTPKGKRGRKLLLPHSFLHVGGGEEKEEGGEEGDDVHDSITPAPVPQSQVL